jgi:nicotinamide phosphoribosyltransferase
MHDYLESRGAEDRADKHVLDKTRFFGLQYYVKRYLSTPITEVEIIEADEIITGQGLEFNRSGWEHILTADGGFIPIRIRAVPEGAVIPAHHVLMTIESTDPAVPWIVGWMETLLMKVWYPTTVATQSYAIHEIIKGYLEDTADTIDKLPFMLQDFGYRGVSSEESAGIGGMAHLTNFKGTDTIAAVLYARKWYGMQGIAGYSIPASEHSTITSWGSGQDNERRAFQNMIRQYGDCPTYACVSDSWDFAKALETWNDLKGEVEAHQGTLVVRPDSGDNLANVLLALRKLDSVYGSTVNTKGYKVLNHVAVIQGDGNDMGTIIKILAAAKAAGYSAQNLCLGMGGALLQGNATASINRDTHRFAIKCSAARVDGKLIDVYKDPATDSGKRSKRGRLDLIRDANGDYKTIRLDEPTYGMGYAKDSVLKTYYDAGKVTCDYKFEDIQL